MPDTPTTPGTPIPPSTGIVVAGKVPLPRLLDLNGDGIPDIQQNWFWDKAIDVGFAIAGYFAPNNAKVMTLRALEPDIKSAVAKVTK